MKNTGKATISSAVCAVVLFLISLPVSAQTQTQTSSKRILLVSIPDRKLAVVEDGSVKKIYSVAVGKNSTPSPTGTFTVMVRVTNPTYYHQGKVVEPGPDNPVGTRWIGLNQKGYGIHGTNVPRSVGKAVSHGCIRMRKLDLEELFLKVQVGDQVEIHAERDVQVAQVFGETNTAMPNALVASATMPQAVGSNVASGQ